MDYYNLIFKRKSFHLFRNRETISKEDMSELKAFTENVVPLDQKIRYYNRIDLGIFLFLLETCLTHEGYSYQGIQFYEDVSDEVEKVVVAKYKYII